MDLTATFDRLCVTMGYCPVCFTNDIESKVYRPKAERSEWIGNQYITHKGEHFSGTCSECGWNTKEGDPISIDEMQSMLSQTANEEVEIEDDEPF